MPKRAKELSALEVARLKPPGLHMVGGVTGLGLQIGESQSARSWVLRYSLDGRRRDKGLGSFPEVGLADARTAARAARAGIRLGEDPIASERAARSAATAARAASKTFSECAAAYVKAKSPEWANAKHVGQWTSTLQTYAEPIIGSLLVKDIDTPHILQILEPIWRLKTETAVRLRGRLENILDWSIARKYRPGPNPARWKGHLALMLPAPGKVAKVSHHAALPYAAVPAFMARLLEIQGEAAKALRFAILCASRSGEVRGALWSEIDLHSRTWTIPPERMKAKRIHRVPLSTAAVRLLQKKTHLNELGFVFPGSRGDCALSDMTLTATMRRMQIDAVPHGFRSSFRDWIAEQTSYPRELAEKALAHTLPDAVEAAYQRGDMLEKRRQMMQAWADYCEGYGDAPMRRRP